jgi:hypothetical protein
MSNNMEGKTPVPEQRISKPAEFEDFVVRTDLWKQQFDPSFANAFTVLVNQVPIDQRDHFLFAKPAVNVSSDVNMDNQKGVAFFEEVRAFDKMWYAIFNEIAMNSDEIDNRIERAEKYENNGIGAVNQELSLLLRIFPQSTFIKNIKNIFDERGSFFTEKEISKHVEVLHAFFMYSQAFICQNWRDWANLKNLATDGDEEWKENLWKNFNNEYILGQITNFLNQKVAGVAEFRRTTDPSNWPLIIDHYAFYFKGYDVLGTKPFLDKYENLRQAGLTEHHMAINPYAANFSGPYLESFIKYLGDQADKKVVYTLQQAELVNYFADLITTYEHNRRPIVEEMVKGFIRKYNIEKIFPGYKPYRLLSI